MTDEQIMARVGELVDEEHRLWEKLAHDTRANDSDRERLAQLQVQLDQCWDLLRQRRARRQAGLDVDDAQTRDPDVVERYRQ